MSEVTPLAPVGAGQDVVDELALGRAVAEAVVQVPGVLRLEPTLVGAMRSLVASENEPGHLVEVSARNALVDVSLSVATAPAHQARAVAHAVRARVVVALEATGARAGEVSVCVLSVAAAEPTVAG
jgi:uncharacterized alkaline shock family protein YloU